jgi:hypothetical protein
VGRECVGVQIAKQAEAQRVHSALVLGARSRPSAMRSTASKVRSARTASFRIASAPLTKTWRIDAFLGEFTIRYISHTLIIGLIAYLE